jgi:hypothetical protein
MSAFSAEYVRDLGDSYTSLQARLDESAKVYAIFPYTTQSGREYAHHGFLRRFNMMHHCIEKVFEILPPEQDGRPPDPALLDATAFIQSFVMNVFGALDNLAWTWVSEKPLDIPRKQIGLGPKCEKVRGSFSPEMGDYLAGLENWFAHIIDFRDALAHRIPLYIPPFVVGLANQAEHEALELRKRETEDADEYYRLFAEQAKFEAFHPLITHSLHDDRQPIWLHSQLVQDFITVEGIAGRVMGELKCLLGQTMGGG